MTTELLRDPLDAPVATCRSRMRQVLEALDGRSSVAHEEVLKLVEDSHCAQGHDLHYAALMDLVVADELGCCRLGRAGVDWLDEEGRPSPDWQASIAVRSAPLRAWQVEALQAWSEHGRRGVVEAVTGTGKSRVGIEATREALSDDYSVVIAVPTRDLVEQWVAALRANAVPGVGAVGDGSPARFGTRRVLVGTVQSLYLQPPTREDGKVLLVGDECHRYGAGQWRRVLHPSYRRRLGLTATFERNDDGINELLAYFGGAPVYRIGFDRAIADGVVAHYDVKLHGIQLDPRERAAYDEAHETVVDCRMRLLTAGFAEEPFGLFLQQVTEAAEDRHGTEDPTVVEIARRYLKAFSERIEVMSSARGKMAAVRQLAPRVTQSSGSLLFTRTVEAAEEIAAVLTDEGVSADAIHSHLTRTQRRDRLDSLKAGRLKAVAAPTVLDEGVDVPAIDLAVVLGGSKSRRQMIQRMGRVLRLKGDGRPATFVVVYARNTVEDLTLNDGQEGCLDLIMHSADSVEHLTRPDLKRLHEESAQESPADPAALDSVEACQPESSHGVGAGPPWPDSPSRQHVERQLASLGGVTSLVLSDRVVADYQNAHSVDADLARQHLRQLLVDLDRDHDRSYRISSQELVVARSGYQLVIDATLRTVSAYDNSGQQQAYPDYLSLGRASASMARPPMKHPDTDSPLQIEQPDELLEYVDFSTVHYSDDAFQRLLRLVDDGRINGWDADRAIRHLMRSDVFDADVVHHLARGEFAVEGTQVLWVFRSDGLSVAAHDPHELKRLGSAGGGERDDQRRSVAADGAPRSATVANAGAQADSIVDQIERLVELKERGYLTEEEFAAAKGKVLG